MGDLSQHFSRSEFKCRGGGCNYDTIDSGTLSVLEAIRSHYNRAITVNSGNRCPDHNKSIGGSSNSQHLYGRAVDFNVTGIAPSEVANWVQANFPKVSVGRYKTFIHIDTRSNGPAYWNG